MKPLPLFLPIGISSLKGKTLSLTTFLLFIFVATSSFGQRSYYEYNNPDAVKINKKVLDLLTSGRWEINDVRWLIRKDTFDYQGRKGNLILQKNGTYSSRGSIGTWQIRYNRYLILKETSNEKHFLRGISGTFGVTSFNDSSLVLRQLYTSSRDMSKTLTLVKARVFQDIEKYRPGGTYRPARKQRILLAPALIDSLTFLSNEVLELLGHREANDTLYINGADSLYKIRLQRDNPLRKVKIFHELTDIEDYEGFSRFTLPADQVPLVDSLAMNYVRKRREDYYPQKEITSLSPYFRQYVGYFDVNGDAIVLLNAFCQYKNNWQESLVQVGLGGVCYFSVSVNLKTKSAFSFYVNDF